MGKRQRQRCVLQRGNTILFVLQRTNYSAYIVSVGVVNGIEQYNVTISAPRRGGIETLLQYNRHYRKWACSAAASAVFAFSDAPSALRNFMGST